MKENPVCPNCGRQIDIRSATVAVKCNQCGEELLISSGQRVVLAHPIQTYLTPDRLGARDARPRSDFSTWVRPPVSVDRRKRTARLAYERMTRQEQLEHSGLVYGILAAVFGVFLVILSWVRLGYFPDDWAGMTGLLLGALVFVAGLFVTLWFARSIRLARIARHELEMEMKSKAPSATVEPSKEQSK